MSIQRDLDLKGRCWRSCSCINVLQSGRDAGVSEKMERSDLLQQESNLRVSGVLARLCLDWSNVCLTHRRALYLCLVCVCVCR